jgi:hypothetical protein
MTTGIQSQDLTDPDLMARLSARFVQAVTEPRIELLEELLTLDFSIYYGTTNGSLNRADALSFFAAYFPTIRLRYRDIRLKRTTDGWVQQHIVDTDGANGFQIRDMPVCVVVTLKGEKIQHIAEYMDGAQTGGFDNSALSGSE